MTDTIEGDHKCRVLTRYRTGSLDRKKRYNLNKIPPDKSREVAKLPQVKVLPCVCACVVYVEHVTQTVYSCVLC